MGTNQWQVENNHIWLHRNHAASHGTGNCGMVPKTASKMFLMFPIANFTQIYLTDRFGYNYWSSWCQSLFSINSRYIRNQKAGRFILVLVHPKVPWCAYTCWNLWELPPPPPPPPCLFNLSLWTSHSGTGGGGQMEWIILACGKAFPLHVYSEVKEKTTMSVVD